MKMIKLTSADKYNYGYVRYVHPSIIRYIGHSDNSDNSIGAYVALKGFNSGLYVLESVEELLREFESATKN